MKNSALQTLKECNKKLTGYELTTALLRGGLAKLELNPTASIVLMYLCSCFNGGVVFPHIKTIAENTGLSESGIKKAIKELILKGCILKAKQHKGNNSNVYTITNKVLDFCKEQRTTQREHSKNPQRTYKSTESELSCSKSNNMKLNNLSEEDLNIIKNYIEHTPHITNKQSYYNKVIQSDCTILLKRLKGEIKAKKRAEKECQRTQELLKQWEQDRINAQGQGIPQSVKDKIAKLKNKYRQNNNI